MSKLKAGQSSIIRTLEDIPSDSFIKGRLIPKGTVGCVIEVYIYPEEGYCADLHIPGEIDDNIILKPHQFEVIEWHDIDIGGYSPALSPKPDNK